MGRYYTGLVTSRRRWSSRLLYLGVLLFFLLVALAALSIRREWQERLGQARADAIFQLVQGRIPARPTETPGATAWLNLELRGYRQRIGDPEKARLYGEVAEWRDNRSVPPFFAPLRELLGSPLAAPSDPAPSLQPPAALGDPPEPFALRSQSYLEMEGRWFVVTRRRNLKDAGASDRFLAAVVPHLLALSRRLPRVLADHPLPAVPGNRPPRVVRLYALSEDGTLVSLPLGAEGGENRQAALLEARQFRKLPELPTFVSNEFYFQFDFAEERPQSFYSGLYLDLGGQGLVDTITVPLRDPALGSRGIVGADLAFTIDWEAFARRIDPPMTAAVVRTGAVGGRQPWREIRDTLPEGSPEALRSAVAALAEPGEEVAVSTSYVLHGVAPGHGAVSVFQVAADTWLVVLFPKKPSHLPFIPVTLSVVMLVLLLAGFERNRRRAELAQGKAEAALREKQNLLNSMQIPLLVVDPNTDQVVSANRAAEALGILPGSSIADRVADDPRARDHYERMQVARPEPRRAYGLPVKVRAEGGGEEERYAIVRSVAVTAPIEALQADERHRLGILFLLEPEADLALLTEDLVSETRADERRKLAGLLTHGVDALVRVLAHCLQARGGPSASPELASWLSHYLDQRLRTTAWLLDHWDALPPLPPDSSIEASQATATLDQLQRVFTLAAADADLRSRLHWDNGVLSARPAAEGPVFTVEIDWPESYWFAVPVRGGFGFFLGEVMINAVRHGRPGSTPVLRVSLDRVRKELHFAVENAARPEPGGGLADRPAESYGGRRILERLARLFDWELTFTPGERGFVTAWRVPASERGDPRRAD
jgi:PAS domain-containing protein